MAKEVMVDLETMAATNNASIVSIGAVMIDTEQLNTVSDFYITVDLESCAPYGFDVEASTVLWWLQQSEHARMQLTGDKRFPIDEALKQFAVWCGNRPVWGNGATFDNVILRNAYRRVGQKCPWHYRNDRCYRTMKELFPEASVPPPNEKKHDALADAHWQAQHLINIYKFIRSGERA